MAGHFGVGIHATVDTLQIIWPDGKSQVLRDIAADQEITLRYAEAKTASSPDINRELSPAAQATLMQEVAASRGVRFRQQEGR